MLGPTFTRYSSPGQCQAIRTVLPAVATAGFTVALTVGGLVLLDWRLALAALAAVPIQVLGLRWYLRTVVPIYRRERVVQGERTHQLNDSVSGARTVRALGLHVCLCTGYARHTQNMILESLGWMGLADLSLCPSDAGRGRPYPDMILTALLGLDHDDVRSVLVVGDTAEDMTAGRRAGAGLVVGVRTGRDADDVLLAAGADRVVPGLADVPDLVVRTR